MPVDRFVLIVLIVVAAAGLTVWIGAYLLAATQVPAVLLGLVPLLLVGYVCWRVIAERLGNREDDHYDRIER